MISGIQRRIIGQTFSEEPHKTNIQDKSLLNFGYRSCESGNLHKQKDFCNHKCSVDEMVKVRHWTPATLRKSNLTQICAQKENECETLADR